MMDDGIRIELLKLANGERILRFEHAFSGVSLEKRLDEDKAVAAQKERWRLSFTALLARESAAV